MLATLLVCVLTSLDNWILIHRLLDFFTFLGDSSVSIIYLVESLHLSYYLSMYSDPCVLTIKIKSRVFFTVV